MASELPTAQSRQASPLLEFLPTPRQLSPLPSETIARRVASEEERFERVREWNESVREQAQPPSRDARIIGDNGKEGSFDQAMGSIYIPQTSSSEIRRSTRIAHKLPTFQTPAGTYYHSSYIPTPEQKAQIIIDCEEVDGIYCISEQDWLRERRQHRILARDFPRYCSDLDIYGTTCENGVRKRATVQILNRLNESVWKLLEYQQADYRPPKSRESTPPTLGFSTDESIPSECGDTDLFGYEVNSPPLSNHGERFDENAGPAED